MISYSTFQISWGQHISRKLVCPSLLPDDRDLKTTCCIKSMWSYVSASTHIHNLTPIDLHLRTPAFERHSDSSPLEVKSGITKWVIIWWTATPHVDQQRPDNLQWAGRDTTCKEYNGKGMGKYVPQYLSIHLCRGCAQKLHICSSSGQLEPFWILEDPKCWEHPYFSVSYLGLWNRWSYQKERFWNAQNQGWLPAEIWRVYFLVRTCYIIWVSAFLNSSSRYIPTCKREVAIFFLLFSLLGRLLLCNIIWVCKRTSIHLRTRNCFRRTTNLFVFCVWEPKSP